MKNFQNLKIKIINNYRKIKESESKLGLSYEEFSEIYNKTNGFSEACDYPDYALMQFVDTNNISNNLKKSKKI